MKIVQVAANIEKQADGVTQTVSGLCRELAKQDVSVRLHALAPTSETSRDNYTVVEHPRSRFAWPLGISPEMKRALKSELAAADICHTHGIWLMPNIYPAWAVRGTHCRLIASPHGMLEPWALRRSRVRKGLVWRLWQREALARAACFHATAESEYESIRRLGFRQPVAIIPIGVDVPESIAAQRNGTGPRRLLYLGRLHPKKGIDILIDAWRRVQDAAPDWELAVVGPDEGGYGAEMQRHAHAIGAKRIAFPGPVYGAARNAAYAAADAFVLPTHSENFGISVAEALAHGVPAIVTKGAPWGGLETHRCGWWIEIGSEPLADRLRSVLLTSPDELRECGARGRAWIERDYSWQSVGAMMAETYRWLVHDENPPAWVRID